MTEHSLLLVPRLSAPLAYLFVQPTCSCGWFGDDTSDGVAAAEQAYAHRASAPPLIECLSPAMQGPSSGTPVPDPSTQTG